MLVKKHPEVPTHGRVHSEPPHHSHMSHIFLYIVNSSSKAGVGCRGQCFGTSRLAERPVMLKTENHQFSGSQICVGYCEGCL